MRIAAVIWCCLSLEAAAVPVRFNLPGPEESQLTIRAAMAKPESKAIVAKVAGTAEIDLEPGTYVVEVAAPGWWLVPQMIAVRGATVVDLPLRRTGTVGGTLAGEIDHSKLVVRFEDPRQETFTGEARCTIEKQRFQCELPEGALDLRVGLQRHVPHYRPGVQVTGGESADLGRFRFVPGASLSGRLAVEEGALRDVRITLAPRKGAGQSFVIKPARDGFFSHGPIEPGEYTLTAAQRGLVSASRPIAIQELLEARLREPLMLSKPRMLRLAITPATDPLGEVWVARLVRQDGGEVAEGAASADGSWSAENIAAGEYQLLVRPQRGPVWHYQDLAIDDSVTTLQIAIKSVRFAASVSLGGEPLSADLLFNGEHSINAIPFKSNEDGKVTGYLPVPGDGRWLVTVKSDEPAVRATIEAVVEHSTDGVARLDIILSSGTIGGKVVDETGKPAARALVTLSDDDAQVQVFANEAGLFEMHGLKHGSYSVVAADFLKESDAAEVVLDDGDEQAELELHLKPYRQWEGTVTTADGQKVHDATVHAVAVDVPILFAHPARTDRDGRFAALTPAGAKLFDVMASPRGYAFSLSRRPVSNQLNIVVDRRGGTLVVEFDNSGGMEAFIWHNGSAVSALAMLSLWQAELETGPPTRTRLRIPQMEPGEYTICPMPPGTDLRTAAPGESCKTLYLAPFATEAVVLTNTSS